MRTHFTGEALLNPDVARSDGVLRRCVHCGFCTAACPTYVLDGNELDSPRGRIMLLQAMLEKGGAPDPLAVRHIDRCLACLACTTACPSGVDYGRLLDHGRAHIEAHHRRLLGERLLRAGLDLVLPRPWLFRLALAAGRAGRPLARFLPRRLRAMLALLPRANDRVPALKPGLYPAEGTARLRVALMPGCVQEVLAPAINQATVRVLTKRGVDVIVPRDLGCCGALSHHLERSASGVHHARHLVARLAPVLDGERLDYIVLNAAGCGTRLKDLPHVLRHAPDLTARAATIAALARDISEVLAAVGLEGVKAPARLRVAYQSACSLQHGQKLDDLPRRLLAAAGFEVVDLDESHLCCGSAGTYNILEPEIADKLRTRKAERIALAAADAVASGNIGCIAHLGPSLRTPICHTIELIDWAAGGPKPAALSARAGA